MQYLKLIIIPLIVVLIAGCKSPQANTPDNLAWGTNLEAAIQTAAKENKAVLVNFTGSDWCMWCQKLNGEVFSQKEFAEYAAKKLVLVKIDFPRSIEQTNEVKFYNQQLASKFNIEGYPTIVLLNSSGSVLGVTGYQPGGAASYVQHLQTIVQ